MHKYKTISGHYDTAYNLAHNNRQFLPRNVDAERVFQNDYCVAAGQAAGPDWAAPHHISEFWKSYKALSDAYWSERNLSQLESDRIYRERMAHLRRCCRQLYPIPHSFAEALVTMLLLPLLIPCGIYLSHAQKQTVEEWKAWNHEQWLKDMTFRAAKNSIREALSQKDLASGSHYLQIMDKTVSDLGKLASEKASQVQPMTSPRFATLEEIYSKLYEPAFQAFQQRQRPCRRFNGTYLEQIRQGQRKHATAKQQSKNVKSRVTAEALEIVFTIGDMDNTGYAQAYTDAKQAEALLGDFCDHLLAQPNLCCVTTKELSDPDWQPPFRNGLIVLNLTVHADEATPGVHLTFIPYSRNCTRGPQVQAAMGRALAGMGYPSTWADVLDENGKPIPKKNKDGEVIHNKDGSVRYQQEPAGQGILDWIAVQKQWLQKEMKQRYDWDREYKGSHPRGNLSTPDYKAARAKERQNQYEQLLQASISQYQKTVEKLSIALDEKLDTFFQHATNQDMIAQYLQLCPDEEYEAVASHAAAYLDRLAVMENDKRYKSIVEQIQKAEDRLGTTEKNSGSVEHIR